MGEEPADTTSFASILLGVKRLRDESEVSEIQQRYNKSSEHEVVAPVKATQIPFTEGERVARGAKPQQKPATVYKRPNIDMSRVNNAARRTVFSNIQISISQKGNPLIKSLRIPFEYNEKMRNCDYLVNSTTFILFLSLKYHKLHPEYVYNRIKKLNGPNGYSLNNNLKTLLCLVDVENNDEIVKELNKICLLNDLSLILLWSFDECANYINYLKQLENSNSHVSIKGTTNEDDYYLTLTNALTSIRQINKTDTINLITKFGSFKNLVLHSTEDQLSEVQGMGKVKINRFVSSLEQNFILNKKYPEVRETLVAEAVQSESEAGEDDFDDFENFLQEMDS